MTKEEQIRKEIHRIYSDGDRVTNKELKFTLQRLYRKHGLKRTATGTQIK
jgi:hypothetical protein